MAFSIVSYIDHDGIKHSVAIEGAESLYEAAIIATRTFRKHAYEPGRGVELEIEVRTSVTHTVTLGKALDWLTSGARSPKEALTKERLRSLIES